MKNTLLAMFLMTVTVTARADFKPVTNPDQYINAILTAYDSDKFKCSSNAAIYDTASMIAGSDGTITRDVLVDDSGSQPSIEIIDYHRSGDRFVIKITTNANHREIAKVNATFETVKDYNYGTLLKPDIRKAWIPSGWYMECQ